MAGQQRGVGLAAALMGVAAGMMGGMASAADRVPAPVPSDPKPMVYESLRGVRYCEIWLFTGTPETGIAGIYYNTSDLNDAADRMDTCPAALWDPISVKKLEETYDVIAAFKNGPRGWTMDRIDLPVGPVVGFEGLETRWMGEGRLPVGMSLAVAHMEPYKPLQSHRKSTMTYAAGKPVFILEDPEGVPWVMQAWGNTVDPELTYETLDKLGEKLKPAPGWKFRVATPKEDLVISTPQGFNWIVQDELQNTYDACKDGACNIQP